MTSGAFRIAQTLALVLTLALSALILDGALPAQAATFTVTRFDDPVPDGCNSGVDCSLREAIIAANAAPGADTIILPAGIYTLAIAGAGDNVAATGDLDITDDLTLTGDGAATTIIDGGALDRVLDILAGSTVEISGVTVRNGTASPFGDGILNEAGSTLTLTAVAVSGNTSSSSGGGISNLSTASLTLNNSTISGNVGISGGGISNNGSTASLTLNNSTVSGNVASSGGGGISNNGSGGTITLTNVTVTGNTAGSGGGGIFAFAGTLALSRSTVFLDT